MNKHKYIGWTTDDRTPRHIVGGPPTGWAFSDAVRRHTCPTCGSEPGYECETKSGRKKWPPHQERYMLTEQFQPRAVNQGETR